MKLDEARFAEFLGKKLYFLMAVLLRGETLFKSNLEAAAAKLACLASNDDESRGQSSILVNIPSFC